MSRKKRAETELDREMERKPDEDGKPNGVGHNSHDLSPDEMKALKFHHFGKVQAQFEKLEVERAEYKRLRKLAKADGIILADLDFMRKCAEIEDPAIVTDRIKREAEIASWFALPIAFQPDMFDLGREPAVDRAYREGFADGLAAKTRAHGYGAGSPQEQSYQRGYNDGQAKVRADFESAMHKRNAAKQSRQDEAEETMKQVGDALPPIEMPAAA